MLIALSLGFTLVVYVSIVKPIHSIIAACIGLNNVNERLQMYYGKKYQLKVESKLGEGTLCRLTIPKNEQEDGNVPHSIS